MHLHTLIPLALIANSAVAKPLPRSRTLPPKRQYSNSSISGITHGPSTDSDPTSAATQSSDAAPACTAVYNTSPELNCGDVASGHGIQLYNQEANCPSTSKDCERLLRGYGVCCVDPTTTSLSASASPPTTTIRVNGPVVNSTTLSYNATTVSITANSSNVVAANSAAITGTTSTSLSMATLTYTVGTGGDASVQTVVVTHTDVTVLTLTTTISPPSLSDASITANTRQASKGSASSPPTQSSTSRAVQATATSSTTTAASVVSTSSSAVATSTSSSVLSMSTSVANATPSANACAAPAPPPAATQSGIVANCTQWYVAVPGDYCYTVAQQFGISVDTFMAWNPAVDPPTCPSMLAGDAYCVATCGSSTAAASISSTTSPTVQETATTGSSTPVNTNESSSSSSTTTSSTLPTASSSQHAYVSYVGDGSTASGWPSMSQWIDFDTMFEANTPDMKASCAQWGVPDDSDDEIADMRSAILSIGADAGIDPRFILAIIMQESTGCVRVITTAYSVFNPGLMQSHNGTGTCNTNNAPLGIPGVAGDGIVQTPCPDSEIQQMIKDGTQGTSSGDGLQQIFAQQGQTGAEGYYRTSRIYNGGSLAASGLLQDGCCTASYSSDVANRLLGWTTGPRTFTG